MEHEMKVKLVAEAAGFSQALAKGTAHINKFSSEIEKKLAKTIRGITTQEELFGRTIQTNASKISAYTSAIRQLGQAGYSPTSKRVLDLAENVRVLSAEQNRLIAQTQKTNSAFRGGTSAAMSFGHIIQDLPYGINGIANNITQLGTQLVYVSNSAKAAGVSVKTALISSMLNPATLAIVGLSAVTTGMQLMARNGEGLAGVLKLVASDTDALTTANSELAKSYADTVSNAKAEVATLQALLSIARDTSRTNKSRLQAIQQINKEYPELNYQLDLHNVNSEKAAKAVDKLTRSMIRKAKIQAAEQLIAEKYNKILDIQSKSAIENANFWDLAASAILNAGNLMTALPDLMGRGMKRAEKDTKELNDELNAVYEQLKALLSLEADEETLFFGDNAKQAVKDFITNLKPITDVNSPIIKGIRNVDKNIEKGLTDAVTRAAETLSAEDFGEVLQRALNLDKEPLKIAIQPDFTGPKGETSMVDSGLLAEQLKQAQHYAQTIGDTVGDMYASMLIDGDKAFDNINRMFDRMLKKMISDIISSGITNLFTQILGGAVTGGTGFLGGLFKGLFSGVPKLASGGILSGPSLVLAGEYPGARSNPEVIAPLNDLKKYGVGDRGDINVTVSGRVDGNDLALVVERVRRGYNRFN